MEHLADGSCCADWTKSTADERVRGVLVRWGFNDLFNDGDQAAKLISEIVEAVNDVNRKV